MTFTKVEVHSDYRLQKDMSRWQLAIQEYGYYMKMSHRPALKHQNVECLAHQPMPNNADDPAASGPGVSETSI